MSEPDRIEQLRADLAELRISDPSSSRDRLLARIGAAGLIAGVVLPFVAYALSHGTTDALEQRDAIVLAVAGVALAAAGGALFLRGSLAGFLRFWFARDLHERRAQTDRVLSALAGDDASGGTRTSEGEWTGHGTA